MTIKTNYFNLDNAYNAADLVAPFESLLNNGVYPGSFTVYAHSPSEMSVDVSAGSATINGFFIRSDSIVNIPIVANISGLGRTDLIVIEVDELNKVTTIKAIEGTPAATPTPPTAAANQLSLASVFIGSNVATIEAGNITDLRSNTTFKIIDNLASGGGYIQLQKNGLILQWGSVTTGTIENYKDGYYYTTTTKEFQIPFKINCLACVPGSTKAGVYCSAQILSKSSMLINASSPAAGKAASTEIYYFAIGI